jgi:uncharacterized membrane protein HdeD (DUF308 family)
MVTVFDRHWWVLALRGVAALVLGAGIFLWPGMTLSALSPLFVVYAMADGVLALIAAVWAARWHVSWWPLLAEGGFDVAAGAVVLLWPGMPLFTLIAFIAVWAILTGASGLLAAVLLRREMAGEWFLLLSGISSVLLGALLLAFPGASVLAVVWLIGAYALAFGVLLLGFSVRLRGWQHRKAPGAAGPRAAVPRA